MIPHVVAQDTSLRITNGMKIVTRHHELIRCQWVPVRRYNLNIRHGHVAEVSSPEDQSKPAADEISKLPLPPLLDPDFIARKRRNAEPKQRPNPEDFTPFQKKLASNPYAHALATHVRQCSFTGAKLPSHCLTTFRPEYRTKQPSEDVKSSDLYMAHASKPSPHFGRSVHVVNSMALLEQATQRTATPRNLVRRMTETLKLGGKAAWSWDDQVAQLVLSSLQDGVVSKLKWAFDMPNAKLIRRLDGVKSSDELTCILQLRPGSASGVNPDGDHVPTFDLASLLGHEKVQALVDGTRFANVDAVGLAESQHTVDAACRLMKLQDYVKR